MSLRVLVVDDTAMFRRAISDALSGVPGIEVVGAASNGKLALSRLATLNPDVLTLDIEMPEMTGLEVLEEMKRARMEPGVIVLSSLTVRGGEMTVKALELGAFDFLTKPDGNSPAENQRYLRERLASILRAFERQREIRTMLRGKTSSSTAASAAAPPAKLSAPASQGAGRPLSRTASRIVLIGVSTGGPAALGSVLPALPSDLGVPILIVQHMPPVFTQALADSLNRKCSIQVQEARDGQVPGPNCAYLAPGGAQLKLAAGPLGQMVMQVSDDPPENGCKPAVDYLFRSVALQFPGRAVAVILTGMGNDGAAGLRMLKRGGCHSIAQDEASCVVFGMPKEAIAAGAVDAVLPLEKIPSAIVNAVRGVTA